MYQSKSIRNPDPALLMGAALVLAYASGARLWIVGTGEPEFIRMLLLFDILLVLPLLLFLIRSQLKSIRTRHLLQFAFILAGGFMLLTGLLGFFRETLSEVLAVLFSLLVPGAALLNLGICFNKPNTGK